MMSMPARFLNSSPDRCTDWPEPDDPNDSLPGSDFASATSSATLRAGTLALTTSTFGTETTIVIGAKSWGL